MCYFSRLLKILENGITVQVKDHEFMWKGPWKFFISLVKESGLSQCDAVIFEQLDSELLELANWLNAPSSAVQMRLHSIPFTNLWCLIEGNPTEHWGVICSISIDVSTLLFVVRIFTSVRLGKVTDDALAFKCTFCGIFLLHSVIITSYDVWLMCAMAQKW